MAILGNQYTKDENDKYKKQEEDLEKQSASQVSEATVHEFIKNIENLLIGKNNVDDLEVPEISITDDIGESEGFSELINAKMANASSISGYKPELNSDTYAPFDPQKRKHNFIMDYKYKDLNGASEVIKEYESVNILYGYSQSFSTLVSALVEEGVELKTKAVMAAYKRRYNDALTFIKKKSISTYNEFREPAITSAFETLAGYEDTEIIRSAVPVVSPSSLVPGKMIVTYGPYYTLYSIADINTAKKHYHDGIDIAANKDGGDYCYSFTDGIIHKIYNKSRRGRNLKVGDEYEPANYICVQADDGTLIYYRHIEDHRKGADRLKEGSKVFAGTLLGKYEDSGQTGGIHIHIDGFADGKNIDILKYIMYKQPNLKVVFAQKEYKDKNGRPCMSPGQMYAAIDEYKSTYAEVVKRSNWPEKSTDRSIVEDMAGVTYTVKENAELQKLISNLLTEVNRKISDIMTHVFHDAMTSVYKIYTLDFTNKVDDININITPGSSAKLSMQGENAPMIQSTGGRTKSATVSFIITSVTDLARLSMIFRVTDTASQQASMLLMTRSMYKAGNSAQRLRHIADYVAQETFEKSIKNIIGQKLSPRFDEPIVITNEFLNALGISTCIPSSLEIQTVDENPGTFKVLITFNAINLGNRNLENLKKMKTGANIPILPLATRLALQQNGNTETTYNEKKMLAIVGSAATKQALAEFMPIYLISKIYRFKNNIETLSNMDQAIDLQDIITSMFVLSNDSVDANIALVERIMYETTERNITGDITFVAAGEAIANGIALITGIVAQMKSKGFTESLVKKGNVIDNLKELYKNPSKTVAVMVATDLGLMMAGAEATAAASMDNEDENYINFNLLTLLPFCMYDMLMEYMNHLKANTVNDFIMGCASDTMKFIDNLSGSGMKAEVVSRFGKPVTLKDGTNIKKTAGVRLFINGMQTNIDPGLEDATDLLKEAAVKYKELTNEKTSVEDAVKRMMHLSVLSMNYLSLAIAKDINQTLIDQGGNGIATSVVSALTNTGAPAMYIGLAGIRATAAMIRISSVDLYVKHITDAINAVITMTQVDKLIGYFIGNDQLSSGITNSMERMYNNSTEDITKLYIEKIQITQRVGNSVYKKYGLRPEILSGSIVTNNFASQEVRQFTAYAGRIILQTLCQQAQAEWEVDGITSPSIEDQMDTILPDRTEAFKRLVIYATEKTVQYLKESGVLEIILLTALGGFIATVGGGASAVGLAVVAVIGAFIKLARAIIEFGIPIYMALKAILDKSVNIILRKGNLLKISVYLTNLIRSGISHSTLLEAGMETGIWFKELIYYSSDIIESNATSFIDFPIFTYMGEPMMPDFWVSKLGFMESTYRTLIDNINSITAMVYENQTSFTSRDYKQLLAKFQDRMLGIDSDAIGNTEVQLYNNLKNGISAEYASLYFIPGHEGNENYIRAAEYISRFSDLFDSYMSKAFKKGSRAFNYGYVYTKVFTSTGDLIAGLPRYKVAEKDCALILEVYPTECKIIPQPILPDILKALDTTQSSTNLNAVISMHAVYSKPILYQAFGNIMSLFSNLREMTKTRVELMEALKPDTVNNLMMLDTLVGSAMGAVGRAGVGNMQRLMHENARNMIKSSLYLRSGYQFPTLKLFFIEEDSEAFYLFDDLYSYASIVDFTVSDDIDSPLQILQLTVTNVFGHLDDISVDKLPEYTFSSDHTGASALNSLMLKIGCKIKLQAGYSTILNEEETIFTGRINSIQFGEITRIEATSMGDSLLEEISMEQVKIYGHADTAETTEDITGAESMSESGLYGLTKGIGLSDGTYGTHITSIKNIIGYVLTDATLKGKLDDYTISPDLQADFDKDISIATSSYMDSIRNKFFPNVMDLMFASSGLNVKTSFNKQLFENINISGGDIVKQDCFIVALKNKGTIWTSLNDTVWDIMQDINMLLPNNTIRVLPYETRSTIVWGGESGYYRFKRGTEFNTMTATAIADKIRFSIESYPKFQTIISAVRANYDNGCRSGQWEAFNASMSLLLLVADYANNMALAYINGRGDNSRINGVRDNLDVTNPSHFNTYMNWLYLSMKDYGSFTSSLDALMHNHRNAMKNLNEAMADKTDAGKVALNNVELSEVDLGGYIEPIYGKYDPDRSKNSVNWEKSLFLKMFFLESAAEYYMNFIFNNAASVSESYKRISDVHVKVSGRDILSNNIMLMEAYNAVKIAYPHSDEMKDIVANLDVDSRTSLGPVPIHYKLDNRVWKVYSTYFRNINIFPSARNSVLSMYAASTLTNLIKQSYGGSITILGDPHIKAGDKVFIYDENCDMYGFIEVQKIVTMFSQQQGFVSVITPAMVARNESILKEHMLTILGNFGVVVQWAMLMLGISALFFKAKDIASRNSTMNSAMQSIGRWVKVDQAKTLSKNLMGKIAEKLGGVFNHAGLSSKGKSLTDIAKTEKMFNDFMRQKGAKEAVQKILKTMVDDKNEVEKLSTELIKTPLTEAIKSSLKSNYKIGINADDITEEAIMGILNKASGKIFDINHRTNVQISEVYFKYIEDGIDEYLRSLLTNKQDLPAGLAAAMIKEMDTYNKLKVVRDYKTIKDIKQILNERYITLNERTMGKAGISIDAASLDPSIDQDTIKAVLLEFSESVVYNKASLADELIRLGKNTIKWGTLGLMTSGFIDAIREFNDLVLNSTLTTHNVTISPMFFRGEPFIANLDGMTRDDGEGVGFIGIMKSRAVTAVKGLYSAISDPTADLYVEYEKAVRETFGKETLNGR